MNKCAVECIGGPIDGGWYEVDLDGPSRVIAPCTPRAAVYELREGKAHFVGWVDVKE